MTFEFGSVAGDSDDCFCDKMMIYYDCNHNHDHDHD